MLRLESSPSFVLAPNMDALAFGQVTISAPTLAEVMQINVGDKDGKASLNIDVQEASDGGREVTVARVDGRPLQAEVNLRGQRIPVFPEALDSVSFTEAECVERIIYASIRGRDIGRSQLQRGWFVRSQGAEIPELNLEDVADFADVIGHFACKRQEELAGQRRNAERRAAGLATLPSLR